MATRLGKKLLLMSPKKSDVASPVKSSDIKYEKVFEFAEGHVRYTFSQRVAVQYTRVPCKDITFYINNLAFLFSAVFPLSLPLGDSQMYPLFLGGGVQKDQGISE